MRKAITITLPADEAAHLAAMLVAFQRYYEIQAVDDGLDQRDARAAQALCTGDCQEDL